MVKLSKMTKLVLCRKMKNNSSSLQSKSIMKRFANHLLFVVAAFALPTLAAPSKTVAKVGFNKDIRPILAENCFACHGPDPGSRKAQLRLDTEAGFFADRGEGPTIVKGKPLDSPLYQRITTKDPDDIMPPPDSHKQLKPEQIALIRRWIEEGAPWQPHWSFLKPERRLCPL